MLSFPSVDPVTMNLELEENFTNVSLPKFGNVCLSLVIILYIKSFPVLSLKVKYLPFNEKSTFKNIYVVCN